MLEQEIEYAEKIIDLLTLQSAIGLLLLIIAAIYGCIKFWHIVLKIFI